MENVFCMSHLKNKQMKIKRLIYQTLAATKVVGSISCGESRQHEESQYKFLCLMSWASNNRNSALYNDFCTGMECSLIRALLKRLRTIV